VERTVWTDERLDDRFERIEKRLDRIEVELQTGMREIRGEIAALRRDMLYGVIALSVGYAGLIAAVLARGL
jgi:hypothetical protein